MLCSFCDSSQFAREFYRESHLWCFHKLLSMCTHFRFALCRCVIELMATVIWQPYNLLAFHVRILYEPTAYSTLSPFYCKHNRFQIVITRASVSNKLRNITTCNPPTNSISTIWNIDHSCTRSLFASAIFRSRASYDRS